jgi:IMP dehydrogenase
VPDTVEIGLGRSARRGYRLDEVALVPTRRTRGASVVSTAWQIDANSFDLPLVAAPSDAVVSPETAELIGRLGGLAVLDGEGLWTRHEDAADRIAELGRGDLDTRALQAAYATPVSPDLLARRIVELRAAGDVVAVRLSPQHTVELAPHVLAAGVDLLVVQGTVISAEHVGRAPNEKGDTALNLKTFTADVDVPIIVGGCTNYQTALHLMRTGAAGVIIGYGAHVGSTTHSALGIDVPMATAIIDAAAARRDYLDETGGRYVHVIADGGIAHSGDLAKAIACGADAVMLGEQLTDVADSPGRGLYWTSAAAHPSLPRSEVTGFGGPGEMDLETVLFGPACAASGSVNLFGALRRAMAKTGYSDLKEFQRVGLTVRS